MENVSPVLHLRKPWLAALLSLVATGLGQVYNGQWKKGVALFAAESLSALILLKAFASFPAMVVSVVVLILFNVCVAGEAFITARRHRQFVPEPCNKVWLYALFFCLSMAVGLASESLIRNCFFQSYTTPSGSMLPTLRVGDYFIVDMMDDATSVLRGDIVVFKFPEDESRDFIKRVVGLPGETVEIRSRTVYVNDVPQTEDFARHGKPTEVPGRDNLAPVTLGADEYFVMGDNREDSYDSRFWGPVRRSAVKGRALYIYFPAEVGTGDWFNRLGKALR